MESQKETKRRFFRKTGLNRAQRSLDSSSPVPSHSHSLDNNSMAVSGSSSGNFGGSLGGSTHTHTNANSHTHTHTRTNPNVSTRTSNSLDETVINSSHQPRRFMAAPRRARSAERFDGMRVAFNSPGDDTHPRNFRSPQLIRTGGSSVTDLGLQRSGPTSASGSGSQTPTMQMPSPPPPYTSAVTDITGPPSYRQAVAAMTAAAQAQGKTPGGTPGIGTGTGKVMGNARNFTMAHRGAQSFDTSVGVSTGTLRSASSVPAFNPQLENEVICNCSKCQVLQRPYEEYNDAVYMESQAFLMHEIMSDGIAFCVIS